MVRTIILFKLDLGFSIESIIKLNMSIGLITDTCTAGLVNIIKSTFTKKLITIITPAAVAGIRYN